MNQISLDKLEKVAKHIFKDKYRNRSANAFSKIGGVILIEARNIMMQDIKSLEYYGFNTNMISVQGITDCNIKNMQIIPDKILYQIFVYQDQQKEGHKLKEKVQK